MFRRLGVELLARTGMRVGELCDLEDDAVTITNGEAWLRIPVGKLHNDRYVPLLPHLVELIGEYQASDGPFTPGRLLSGAEGPLNRYAVDRWIKTIAQRLPGSPPTSTPTGFVTRSRLKPSTAA